MNANTAAVLRVIGGAIAIGCTVFVIVSLFATHESSPIIGGLMACGVALAVGGKRTGNS